MAPPSKTRLYEAVLRQRAASSSLPKPSPKKKKAVSTKKQLAVVVVEPKKTVVVAGLKRNPKIAIRAAVEVRKTMKRNRPKKQRRAKAPPKKSAVQILSEEVISKRKRSAPPPIDRRALALVPLPRRAGDTRPDYLRTVYRPRGPRRPPPPPLVVIDPPISSRPHQGREERERQEFGFRQSGRPLSVDFSDSDSDSISSVPRTTLPVIEMGYQTPYIDNVTGAAVPKIYN